MGGASATSSTVAANADATLGSLFAIAADPGSPVGLAINNIITYLSLATGFFIALLLLYSCLEYYAVWTIRSRSLQHLLAKGDARDPETLAEELRRGVFPRSLAFGRISRIVALREVPSVGIESLAATDAERAASRFALPKYLAAVPTILGLIGTLWGLSVAIAAIQPIITDIKQFEDLPKLLDAIGATLIGMKTAFTTSIVGLIASLALTGGATLASAVSSSALSLLDDTTESYLVPLLAVRHWESQADRFVSTLQESTEDLKDMSVTMSDWSSSLAGAAENAKAASSQLVQSATSFGETTSAMKEVNGSLSSKVETLSSAVSRAATASETINRSIDELNQDRVDFKETLSVVQSRLGDVVAEIHKIAEGKPELFAGAIEVLKQRSEKHIIRAVDHIEDNMQQRLHNFDQNVHQILNTFAANKAELDRLQGQLIEIQQQLSQMQKPKRRFGRARSWDAS